MHGEYKLNRPFDRNAAYAAVSEVVPIVVMKLDQGAGGVVGVWAVPIGGSVAQHTADGQGKHEQQREEGYSPRPRSLSGRRLMLHLISLL